MDYINDFFATVKRKDDSTIIGADEARELTSLAKKAKLDYVIRDLINPKVKSAIKQGQNYTRITEQDFKSALGTEYPNLSTITEGGIETRLIELGYKVTIRDFDKKVRHIILEW